MRRRLAWSWAFLVVGLRGIAEALWDLVRHPRRVLVVVALLMVMVGGSVASARPAVAQEEEKRSIGVVCIGRVLDLFLIDLPEETQMIAIVVTDGFKCPSEGIG